MKHKRFFFLLFSFFFSFFFFLCFCFCLVDVTIVNSLNGCSQETWTFLYIILLQRIFVVSLKNISRFFFIIKSETIQNVIHVQLFPIFKVFSHSCNFSLFGSYFYTWLPVHFVCILYVLYEKSLNKFYFFCIYIYIFFFFSNFFGGVSPSSPYPFVHVAMLTKEFKIWFCYKK